MTCYKSVNLMDVQLEVVCGDACFILGWRLDNSSEHPLSNDLMFFTAEADLQLD